MYLPQLPYGASKTKQQVIAFGGLNYGRDTAPGELAECENLSSRQFPALSQREGRKQVGAYEKASGIYARGALCVVEGDSFLYDGKVVGSLTPGEKQFATINTKVVIFPDKKYFDTASGVFGDLEARIETVPGAVTFEAESLTVMAACCYFETGEEEVKDGYLASDTLTVYGGVSINSGSGALTFSGQATRTYKTLMSEDKLDKGSGTFWTVVKAETYHEGEVEKAILTYKVSTVARFTYPDLAKLFFPGDALHIEGCTAARNNQVPIVRSIEGMTLHFSGTAFVPGVEAKSITITRKVPELSCICESDNRIWGAQGSTIWASALGDPRNFYVYDGLSTDSYAAAVGSEGEFTGCIAYGSTVLFWKEQCLHKILGSYPAQYEIYTYKVQGLQEGSHKSMAIINETLFYKGKNGVYAYTGGAPQLITQNFGTRRFENAVAGTDMERYYISMKEVETGQWSLFSFDALGRIWLREDDTHVADFAYLDGVLYGLDRDRSKLFQLGQKEEEPIVWSATFAPFTEEVQGRKRYSRLFLRCELEAGAHLQVEISVDGTPFETVCFHHNREEKTFTVPILPNRCDSFQVRLSGRGRCVLRSMVREFSVGSEV